MCLFLLVAFIILPAVEIAVFVQVGGVVGVGPTLLAVFLSALAGIALVRSQGLAALARVRESLERHEPPVEGVLDGALVLVGGLLLIVPGFVTDVAGLLLLVPPLRALMRRAAMRAAMRSGRVTVAAGQASYMSTGQVIDAEWHVVDGDKPELPLSRLPPNPD